MRDIHRIKPIMEELTAIWEENPDWRFGQLVSNVLGEVMKKYNISDMFFPEDDFWLNGIREYRKIIVYITMVKIFLIIRQIKQW